MSWPNFHHCRNLHLTFTASPSFTFFPNDVGNDGFVSEPAAATTQAPTRVQHAWDT